MESSSIDRLRHPVWDVFGYFLKHQIGQACNMCWPAIDVNDEELTEMFHHCLGKLSDGYTQKEMFSTAAPLITSPRQHAIFSELCSWMFSTAGVLPNLYPYLLPQYAAEGDQYDMQRIKANAIEYSSGIDHAPVLTRQSDLFRLPSELLDMVLEHVPAQDINDLRLTCRQARMKTFHFWSKNFFRTRQFMIDEYSLQTLLDISRHPELSKSLRHLIIGVDEIDTRDTLAYTRTCHVESPPGYPKLFQYWRDAAAAQQALLNTGRAVELLSSAMSGLSNLNALSVTGSELFRYAPYYSRVYRYPDLGFRSYGSSAYQMQPRYTTTGMTNTKGFPDRVFNVALNSLLRSTTRVTSLRTNLFLDDVLEHLDDEAFDLAPLQHRQTNAAAMLGVLSELHLDVSLESQMLDKSDSITDHVHIFDTSNFGLRQLLTFACNLESLSLNFFGGQQIEGHCDFTAWLCEPVQDAEADTPSGKKGGKSPSPVSWNPLPVSLPSLHRLVLDGLFLSPKQLRAIFTKFQGLRSVSLQGVYLRRCFLDDQPAPEDSDGVKNLWASFFRTPGAATALAKLETLELDNLAVMQYRQDPDDGIAVSPRDIELIFFDQGQAGDDEPLPSFTTVTNFGEDALRKLAGEMRLGRDLTPEADGEEEDEADD